MIDDEVMEFRSETCMYPDIVVQFTGEDGNAVSLLGKVSRALSKAGVPKMGRDDFMAEAMSGDYDHLIQTCMEWVTII